MMRSDYSCGNRMVSRRAFILLVVTVVVSLLTLAAYTFTGTMLVENQASMMFGRDVEARMMAESAIEFAAMRIAEHQADPSSVDLFHDPQTFQGVMLEESPVPRGQVRFSVVVPNDSSNLSTNMRFGVLSENSRFNLNRLLEFVDDEDETTDPYLALSYVPGMTEDIAAAIVDWIDSDDERSLGGAESADYELLAIPYSARNGPMESIDELLKIQGVTPALFYGEDANRNGVLDPNENDGAASLPLDDQDDELDIGWREYFTVSSRELNTMPDGAERINLNQGLMTELFDAIEPDYGEEAAQFVVAYRLFGNENASAATQASLTVAQKDAATAVGKAVTGGVEGSVTRAGLDLTQVAGFSFRSIYDLIDAEIPATVNGGMTTLISPWTSENVLIDMAELEQIFTWVDDAYFDGRVNINTAPHHVLMAIPGMTESIADAIIAARPQISADGFSRNVMAVRTTPAWILAEGIVDLETLQLLGPWLTTGGGIYRFQAVGHYDQGGPNTRLEAMIDATQSPPRIIFQRDLTSLGRGFHPSYLTPGAELSR
ncbi:MAG: general secretion pathway protein GspK [Planctomycetaceae bacterium]|nr:general secretion pathway protein GspK [Planctomycetaceae bacterium]